MDGKWFETSAPDRYELLKNFAKENRTKMTESECVAELFKRYQALTARKEDEKRP